MKISIVIGTISTLLVTATTSVFAASDDITYKVVSLVPNNQTLGVIVDDKLYSLESVDKSSSLLHYGKAPAAESGYKYAIIQKDDKQVISMENFTRTASKEDTLNEYFGRSWNTFPNITKLPNILPPLPIIDRIESNLHIEGQIPTIHLTGNQTAIDYMHSNQLEDIKVDLSMTYISPNDTKTFEDVTFSVGGNSNRRMPKLSYKIKLDKKDDLYGYSRFKLRSMIMDPSFMKENLAYNMAESVGLFSTKHSYVRVYINNQAIGLFGLVEHLKDNWVTNEFGDGSKKFKQGAFYVADVNAKKNGTSSGGSTSSTGNQNSFPDFGGDGALPKNGSIDVNKILDLMLNMTPCDLSYVGNNVSDYSYGQYSVKVEPSVGTANFTRIMELTKFISEQPTATTNDSVVPLWEEKMDTDSFLRGLALEILISNIDGYLGIGNNYILYDDISQDRLVFSEQDLDLVMGITMFDPEVIHGGNYSKFLGFSKRPVSTHMVQVPQFKKYFENLILKGAQELIHPSVIGARVDQLFNMLSEDVAWDFSLPRVGKFSFEIPGFGGNNNETANPMAFFNDLSNIPYKSFVYGPSVTNISMALMDWANLKSSNIITFFNQTSS